MIESLHRRWLWVVFYFFRVDVILYALGTVWELHKPYIQKSGLLSKMVEETSKKSAVTESASEENDSVEGKQRKKSSYDVLHCYQITIGDDVHVGTMFSYCSRQTFCGGKFWSFLFSLTPSFLVHYLCKGPFYTCYFAHCDCHPSVCNKLMTVFAARYPCMIQSSLSSTLSSVKHILQDVNRKALNLTCKQSLRQSPHCDLRNEIFRNPNGHHYWSNLQIIWWTFFLV